MPVWELCTALMLCDTLLLRFLGDARDARDAHATQHKQFVFQKGAKFQKPRLWRQQSGGQRKW